MNISEIKDKVENLAKTHRAGKRLTRDAVDLLLSYIDMLEYQQYRLHNQYAHEGGKPQIMTIEIAKSWLSAIDIPICTDIYQTKVPNVFYASFSLPLNAEHRLQISGALGFDVIDTDSPLPNRYMLKWRTPPNDEV